MPLFDIDDASSEAATLVNLADLLSECEAAQELTEHSDGTDQENITATRAHVTVGPSQPPDDGDEFSKDELADLFCQFQIYSPMDGGGRVVRKSSSSFDRPDESNTFEMITRRLCRECDLTDRSDVYLHFLSLIGQLETQLITTAETHSDCNPLDIVITRVQGPGFGRRTTRGKQGEYLFVIHSISWGDSTGDE